MSCEQATIQDGPTGPDRLISGGFSQPMTDAEQVTGRGGTERRILLSSMRSGLRTQPAPLVRGSSRRITIVRFRPADIRVINRRICLSPCHPHRILHLLAPISSGGENS